MTSRASRVYLASQDSFASTGPIGTNEKTILKNKMVSLKIFGFCFRESE